MWWYSVLRGVIWPPLTCAGLSISSGRLWIFRPLLTSWPWCWRPRRFCLPGPGDCVASETAKLLAKAFDRVEARHRPSDPGADLPFEVLLREALIEVQVELEVRNERDRRKIRKAARRLHAAEELLSRIPSIAAAAEEPGKRPGFGFAPAEQRPPPAVPAWHPDHPLNDPEVNHEFPPQAGT